MKLPSVRKVFRLRVVPLYALGGLLFWLARPSLLGFAFGVTLVVLGEGVRAWGAGHLVKNDRLTVSGPYSFLRHPLYLGSLLIGSGFLLMGGGPALWLLPIGLVFFFAYYFPYKERIESARLERLYGEPYARYRAAVPALWPLRGGWSDAATAAGPGQGWSAERFLENDESGTALVVALGIATLVVRAALLHG